MKSCAFDYERPRDVSQAIALLKDENAKAAAGTQSLGPMLNLRIVQPSLLVVVEHMAEQPAGNRAHRRTDQRAAAAATIGAADQRA